MNNRKAESQESTRSRKWLYVIAAASSILIITTALLYSYYYAPQPPPARAAIIDQLSSSHLSNMSRFQNRTFIDAAGELLHKRFSDVDYYSDNATVDNYKNLASSGYKLIIWRTHSAVDSEQRYIAISTSERNGSKNYDQYSNGELVWCVITGDPYRYFAITPKFIEESMSGRFEDTVIILMSCNGLDPNYIKTAQAFIAKGAKIFISWNSWIDSSGNDNSTAYLLRYLIDESNTISEAVNKIPTQLSEWGPCKLDFYPRSDLEGEYHIPDYRQDRIVSNTASVSDGVSPSDVSSVLKRSSIADSVDQHQQY